MKDGEGVAVDISKVVLGFVHAENGRENIAIVGLLRDVTSPTTRAAPCANNSVMHFKI